MQSIRVNEAKNTQPSRASKRAYRAPSFAVSKSEHRTIVEIADRATAIAARNNLEYSRVDAMMDITAAHANGCPLKLTELLSAEQFDFAHDVFGIRRHINRATGEVEGHFLPRYSAL